MEVALIQSGASSSHQLVRDKTAPQTSTRS